MNTGHRTNVFFFGKFIRFIACYPQFAVPSHISYVCVCVFWEGGIGDYNTIRNRTHICARARAHKYSVLCNML